MNKKLWTRLFKMLKPYRKTLMLSMGLSILITTISATIPIIQQKMIDEGLVKINVEILVQFTAVAIILALIGGIITYLNSSLQINVNLKFVRNMQTEVLEHSLKLKSSYLRNDGILKIINDANYNIQTISRITGSEFYSVFLQVFTVVGIAIGLTIINWRLAIVVMITVPVRFLITKLLGKSVSKAAKNAIRVNKDLHRWESDVYSSGSVNEIKLWNLYSKKKSEYKQLLEQRDKTTKKVSLVIYKQDLFGNGAQNILINLIYIISAFMIWGHNLTIGGLLSFLTYSNLLVQPVGLISTVKLLIDQIEPALNSYDEFLNMEQEETSIEENQKKRYSLPQAIEIEFKNVSFCYSPKTIFENVNFTLRTGEKIALIGENGSGKTTLINLLLRFYEPTQGVITLNNENIDKMELNNYRELIAVVSQFPYLFQGSIYENITVFGRNPVKDIDLDKIDMLSFVKRLPNQMKTMVGSESGNISGGEKQKIALVRALLKMQSKVLILDEATSNYDTQSEIIFDDLLKEVSDKIVIIITHRPEMLKLVDKIICIKNNTANVYNDYESFSNFKEQTLEYKEV